MCTSRLIYIIMKINCFLRFISDTHTKYIDVFVALEA